MVVASPWPRSTSQSVIRAMAVALSRPCSEIASLAELIIGPAPVYAPPSKPSGGCTVRITGSPNLSANSKSRVSSPGTAMIAPVP